MRRTDRQLLGRLDALRGKERTTCVEILLVLVEVERRKLHVSLGYSSLFAFATRHLCYSESAAGRRVQGARCLRDHPEIIPLLRRGVVNLSTISLVSRVLTPANKKALLAKIAGKSQREVEAVVAQHEPPRSVRDRIRPVKVPRVEQSALAGPAAGALELEPQAVQVASGDQIATPENHSGSESGIQRHTSLDRETAAHPDEQRRVAVQAGAAADVAGAPADDAGTPANDSRGMGSSSSAGGTRYKVQFAAGPEFMQKFEEARALLSGRFPRGASIESVFEACMDAYLDRNSPARRTERRKAREEKRVARMVQTTRTRTVEPVANQTAEQFRHALPLRESSVERSAGSRGTQTSRRPAIPAAVRDAIFERDGGRCTFVGVDGHRCGARHALEIDHCQPVARGGSSTMDNLRLLCTVHNRLEAERVFGAAWMQRFERPQATSSRP